MNTHTHTLTHTRTHTHTHTHTVVLGLNSVCGYVALKDPLVSDYQRVLKIIGRFINELLLLLAPVTPPLPASLSVGTEVQTET